MMKISTKGRYGLRIMTDLAVNGKDGCVSLKDIAEREHLSEKYLEQIIGKLTKAELVEYPIVLRAMTQGRGSFEYTVTGYDTVPANIAQKIVEAYKKENS